MIAGMLHGAFIVYRHGTDKTSIYDWGIHQLPADPHPMGYTEEIICEARVPVYTASDPQAILRDDIDRAMKVLADELTRQVQTRSDLAGIRAQFAHIREHGKPKPPVQVVDEHDWSKIWAQTVIITPT
jgi:hypothetical protein